VDARDYELCAGQRAPRSALIVAGEPLVREARDLIRVRLQPGSILRGVTLSLNRGKRLDPPRGPSTNGG
jgi:hypothetical protein